MCSTHHHPSVSCSRCHHRVTEFRRDLWRSPLLTWRPQGAGHFEAFWTVISQAAACFSCVQTQSCNIFYLLLQRSVCNLLQIYFNISKIIHMKRLENKTYKLLFHLLYLYYYRYEMKAIPCPSNLLFPKGVSYSINNIHFADLSLLCNIYTQSKEGVPEM